MGQARRPIRPQLRRPVTSDGHTAPLGGFHTGVATGRGSFGVSRPQVTEFPTLDLFNPGPWVEAQKQIIAGYIPRAVALMTGLVIVFIAVTRLSAAPVKQATNFVSPAARIARKVRR